MRAFLILVALFSALFGWSDLDREILQNKSYFKEAIKNPALRDGENIIFSDLDGDRKSEVVIWQGCYSKRGVDFFRLVVLDNNADIAWRSRCKRDKKSPFCLYSSEDRYALPVVVADIDGDGKKELIVEVKRDFGESIFRIFSWSKDGFKFEREAFLVLDKSGEFIWADSIDGFDGWLSELSDWGKRGVKATLEILVPKERKVDIKTKEIFIKFKNGKIVRVR